MAIGRWGNSRISGAAAGVPGEGGRKSKTFTSWLRGNERHEQALLQFLDAILSDSADNIFRQELLILIAEIAPLGVPISIKAPSCGTSFWWIRTTGVPSLQEAHRLDRIPRTRRVGRSAGLLDELASDWCNGAIKLFLAYKALEFCGAHRELFMNGAISRRTWRESAPNTRSLSPGIRLGGATGAIQA